MPCISNSKICSSIGVSIDCLKQIFQNEQSEIILTIIDDKQFPVDLDDVSKISISLFDSRNTSIATYLYPLETHQIQIIDNWFSNLEITILQEKLVNTFDNPTTDIILNKGKISFQITPEISKYLMIGTAVISIKITYKNEQTIIKCFQIGNIIKNIF